MRRLARAHPLRAAALATALAVFGVSRPAAAQQPAPAPDADRYVVVHVTDASTGAAVADADVWIGHTRATTDSTGRALLPLRRARETVTIRRLGFSETRKEVTAAGSVEVPIAPNPVRMRAVAATARRMPLSPPLRGFYQRLESGRGAFLTRDQIEHRHPRRLTDLFHEIPGVRVEPTNRGERLVMDGALPVMNQVNARWESGDCPVQYYLDGITYLPDYANVPNDVRPDEIEGIEVYRRISEVPVQFRRPGAECGVVVIWLKERV